MLRIVRALSDGTEFAVVILGAFGIFMLTSFATLLYPVPIESDTDGGLMSLVIHELIVGAVLGIFLWVRGWTPRRLGLGFDLREALQGAALAIAALAAQVAVWLLVAHLVPEYLTLQEVTEVNLNEVAITAAPVGLGTVIVLSLVNSVFEETFVSAYVITVLSGRTTVNSAIAISAGIRMLYHFYQGLPLAAGVAAIGVVFAYWYVRRGRLLPLIVAHAILDLHALLPATQL